MLFTLSDRGRGDVWQLDASQNATPLTSTPSSEMFARVPPDGRWVSMQSNESGRFEVYIAPYPDLAHEIAVSSAGGVFAAWSSDERELFHREGVAMMAVTVDTSAGPRVGMPRRLFSDRSYVGTGGDLSFDVAQDGRFLMVKDFRVSESRHSVVVSNWFDDLTRHVGDASR